MTENILHIGFPKTATSWLQRAVFDNPEIHLQTVSRSLIQEEFLYPKDLDYDEEKAKSLIFSAMKKIEKGGKKPVFSHEHLTGHAPSGGYYNFNFARRLKSLFGKAKVIMIIRNQKDMIYSSYLHYIRTGGRCSISRFLNPPKDGRLPLFKYEYFQYDKLIELYFDLFGKENVLVLPYELFKKDPDRYVYEITDFMDVQMPSELPYSIIQNRSLRGLGIAFKRMSNNIISYKESLNADVPILISRNKAEFLKGVFNKLADFTPTITKRISKQISRQIVYNIQGRYIESNSKTAKLIGIDLDDYNYEMKVKSNVQKSALAS